MKRENKRKLLSNIGWEAERYFMILEFFILMIAMLYLLYLVFGTVNETARLAATATKSDLERLFDQLNFLVVLRTSIVFVLLCGVNLLLGLFFLHRLTGPLVRIKAVLNQIAGGKVPETKVILRKGDFPKDVADALTEALQKIRQWRR